MNYLRTTIPQLINHSELTKGTRNRRKLVTQCIYGREKWGCCQLLNFPAAPTEWHTCRNTPYHVNARTLPPICVDIAELPGQGRWLTHAITSPLKHPAAASTSPTKYWSRCGRRPPPTILQGCPFCSGTYRNLWFHQVRHHRHFVNSLWGGINSKMEKITCCFHLIFLWHLTSIGWTGHATHSGGTRNDYIILAGECQGKRTLGRSEKRWYNIRILKKGGENGY